VVHYVCSIVENTFAPLRKLLTQRRKEAKTRRWTGVDDRSGATLSRASSYTWDRGFRPNGQLPDVTAILLHEGFKQRPN